MEVNYVIKDNERIELKEKIKAVILNSRKPCHVKNIALQVGCTSYLSLKLLLEILIEDLVSKNPDAFKSLEILPVKTTKSLIFMSSKMIGGI